MKRTEALAIVKELEDFFLKADAPGKYEEAISFTRKKVFALNSGVSFHPEASQVTNRAELFYSTRKWERWGAERSRALLIQSVARVQMRINMAPDSAFN